MEHPSADPSSAASTPSVRQASSEDGVPPEPFDAALAASVANLLADVAATESWNLATFVRLAGTYETLTGRVGDVLDCADAWGDSLEPASVDDVLERLDTITELLRAAEQDDTVAEDTLRAIRRELPVEPEDERLVTAVLRVDPIRFHRPSVQLLPMLLRQLSGWRFHGSHRMLTVPVWLQRHLESLDPWSGIHVVGVLQDVPDGDILEVANSLWEPRETCEYQSPIAVLAAARRLVE